MGCSMYWGRKSRRSGQTPRPGPPLSSKRSSASERLQRRLSLRFHPDASVMHQVYLALDDLLAILRMLHRLTLEVQVFRVDGLLVHDLIELRAQILKPV